MTSEKRILRTLDLVTTARLASLGASRQEAARQIRQILGSRNIVGIGMAEKISSTRGPTGKLALVFYVDKKHDSRKLKGHEVVPPAVPEALTGGQPVLTDVVALGKVKPAKPTPAPADGVKARRGTQVVLDRRRRIGFVRDVNFRLLVSYNGAKDVAFREQVLSTGLGRAVAGTVVVERHSGRPVGRYSASFADGCLFDPAGPAVKGTVPGLGSRVR